MTPAFGTCAAVTLISAAISFGFSMAAAFKTSGQAKTMAFYAVARSLAFALIGLVPFATGSTSWLEAVAVGMTIIQFCDAIIGVTINDRMKTFGPAGTAIANLAALAWITST